jgi:NADH-quinone oxidoreductase subunit N
MNILLLQSFTPEIFLSLIILFQLINNSILIKNTKYNFPLLNFEIFSQTLFILICLVFLFLNLKIEGFFTNFLFLNDESTRYIKLFITVSSLCILFSIAESFSSQKLNFFEFYILFLFSIFSLFLIVSCYDLISFYICIEMQSLCFYILACFKRDSTFSTEAGLKYFISGSFISGFFLLGASMIYFTLGTLNLNNISLLLYFPLDLIYKPFFVLVGIILVTCMLLFKITCAPFHFWSPDVYEGAPLSSTIIFSIIPKIGLFFFFIKWISCLNCLYSELSSVLLYFGLFSVFIGTFFAISQKRVKRLVIYSSIAQVGFLVAALSLNTFGGFSSVFFFLIVYIITSILIWSHISLLTSFHTSVNYYYSKNSNSFLLSSLTNFFYKNSLWAFSFVIMLFSIAGIPPLPGFLSKIFVLFELLECNNILESIFLIVISSISVFYYIRLIKIIHFEPNSDPLTKETFQVTFFNNNIDTSYLIISSGLFFLFFLFFNPSLTLLFCQYIVSCLIGF